MFDDPENTMQNVRALTLENEVIESPENEQQIEAAPHQEVSAAERNWREVRERLKRTEQERDEALRLAEDLKNAQQKLDDYELNVDADDYAQGKHLSKIQKEIKSLKEEIKSYKQESTLNNVETRLKSQYNDFDKVVTQKSINILREEYPELFSTINSSNDMYTKAVSAYTLIKKFGLNGPSQSMQNSEAINANINKPRPASSIGAQTGTQPLQRANAFANGLTDELKEQLLREMTTYKSNFFDF